MKQARRYLLMIFLCLQAACASVLSGNSQDVEINANTDSVDVFLNDDFLGKTPLTTTILKHSDQVLTLRKIGYKSLKVVLKTKIDSHFWWNLPFTVLGVTGMSTDYGSGSLYQISPAHFYVKMKPLDFKSQNSSDGEDIEIFELFGKVDLDNEKARHQKGLWSETRAHLQEIESQP